MASNVFVVDSTFRRTQIMVQPNTYLRSVLEEACSKLKIDPDQYTLKTDKQKQLDLSLTFRLSGLSPGAKLQLTQASRSPSVVNVALALPQSEGGIRLQDKFPSNTSLWLVLRKFEEGVAGGVSLAKKLNLTSRGVPSTDTGAGRLNYEQPCLNIMGRELSSFTDLQKTLAQLGYNSGSVLVRLTFKQDGTAMEEAMAQISQYFQAAQPGASSQPETTAAKGVHAAADVEMISAPDASAENAAAPLEESAGPEPSEDTVMTPAPPSDSTPAPTDGDDVIASSSITETPSTESQFPSLQQSDKSSTTQPSSPTASDTTSAPQASKPAFRVYAAPKDNTPAAARHDFNESDFAPSIEHAQAHQAILNRQSQNKRLQSDRELEAAAASKQQSLTEVKVVPIRLRLADDMQVEFDHPATDTTAALFESVRSYMDDPSLGFRLHYRDDKGCAHFLEPTSSARLIDDLGFKGGVTVRQVWNDDVSNAARSKPILKSRFRQMAVEHNVPDLSKEAREAAEREARDGKQKEDQDKSQQQPSKKKSTFSIAEKEARLMKRLGFGKK
ncbi:hypothetical protein AAFC00_003813 [Neodothiora populina]|uniref:TUG ubiquitin-like domain-containing protein n=1 Tax=Neodothiora populina TaxID=2781224 RepID=A0ABR3PFQ5_9PEZI